MLKLIRTDSSNTDFQTLVALLDQDLRIRDGADHAFYAQFNQIDAIRHAVVAYVNDEAVGCGAFKPYGDSANTVEIKRMFTRPKFRGQRIAERVLQELEAWAVELNVTEFILETGQRQPEAIRLYQRCEIIPNFGQYEGDENSVCMQKIIR